MMAQEDVSVFEPHMTLDDASELKVDDAVDF